MTFDWDNWLQDTIDKIYDENNIDTEDRNIQVVLLALQDCIKGTKSLEDFAILSLAFSYGCKINIVTGE